MEGRQATIGSVSNSNKALSFQVFLSKTCKLDPAAIRKINHSFSGNYVDGWHNISREGIESENGHVEEICTIFKVENQAQPAARLKRKHICSSKPYQSVKTRAAKNCVIAIPANQNIISGTANY